MFIRSLQDFLSQSREDFDEPKQEAKATLPNVNYRTVTRRQRVVIPSRYLSGWLLLLLVLSAVSLPNTQAMNDASEDGSVKLSEWTYQVWHQTASLLPALTHFYHSHTLVIHQPNKYNTTPDNQIWHFKWIQRYKTQPKVDILLHTSVENCKLILHLQNSSKITYNISFLKNVIQSSSMHVGEEKIFNLEKSKISSVTGEWWVADVTKYLTDWLLDFSEFSVEFGISSPREGTIYIGQQDLRPSPQPVVCVHESGIQRFKEADHIKAIIKNFIESESEKMRLNSFNGSDNGNITFQKVASKAKHTRKRRETTGQCQVSLLLLH
nr:uncharacterized protein LOC128696786 [Cherax quadricarinatus]